jgi:hypothetical protein
VVEGGTPAVDQGTSMLSAAVEGKTIRELPLNGRDWTQLATLEPGVSTITTQTPTVLGNAGRANRGWGTQLTVGGAHPQQNNYRVDGISINDYSGGGPGNTLGGNLGVEAIQEFSVVTANPSADYGKTSGGVFNALTRSGTNAFHGSAYEFYRDSALDARNYFDGAEPPPFRRHQFGASAGGPVRRDRTFLFADYEGLREDLSTTNLLTVPSRAARAGALVSGTVAVDPKVAPYLGFFPLPDVSEAGDIGIASLVQKTTTREDFFTARLDHTFSAADSMHGTFFIENAETQGPDNFNLSQLANISRRRLVTLEHTHILGASLVNTARVGFSRVVAFAPETRETLDSRMEDPSFAFVPGGRIGSLNVSGLTLFPGVQSQGSVFHYNSYQAYDDLFYTRGRHALKFGVSLERIQLNQYALANTNGVFQFGSVRNFLINQPQNFQVAQVAEENPTYLRQTVVGAYVQDDFRARPTLTLNLGLRYEMTTVPTEKYDRLATLASLTDAAPRLGSPYFQNPTYLNFSPRLGFSWDPFGNGKTAVRGGFGLYDTLPLVPLFEVLTLTQAPFTRTAVVANPPRGSFPTGGLQLVTPESDRVNYVEQDPKRSYVLQWNVNVQRELLRDLVLQVGYVGTRGVHQPYRTQDADIVLPTATAEGLFWPTPRLSGTRLNSRVGQIAALTWQGSTSYNALNLKLTRRPRRGIQGGLSYTWAKSVDTNSASVVGGQFANTINGLPLQFDDRWRGPSDFDVRHSLMINYLWEVPAPRSGNVVLRSLASGWQWGGILKAQTGLSFSALIGGDSLGMRSNNPFNFPDRLTTPECSRAVNPGSVTSYIKTECFVVPSPTNRMGNAGRNSLTGPGLVNLDMSFYKNNYVRSISDTFNLQLRLEIFNLLNHPNFRPPTGAQAQVFTVNFAPNPAAGRLTSTATTSRQIQLAVKLAW